MSDNIENENSRFFYRTDGSAFSLWDLLYNSITLSSSMDYIRGALQEEIYSGCKSEEKLNRILKEMVDVAARMRNLSQELVCMFKNNNALYLSKKINR